MNRDESVKRPKGRGPEVFHRDGLYVIHPFEPTGGTWICTNALGNSFALLNWYSAAEAVHLENPRSRGSLTRDVSSARNPSEVEDRLAPDKLSRTMPFRLLGFFYRTRQIIEWRWNGFSLENRDHPWIQNMWVSSGFDERKAQQVRRQTLETHQQPDGSSIIEWLRSFHRSHEPEPGPFSVCMHRDDAATVSYTEIETDSEKTLLRYFPGPLCESPKSHMKELMMTGEDSKVLKSIG